MIYSLDLFSGAGGFTLGLKNAGIKCVGAVEIDRFASETFRTNFPDIPQYQDDVRLFGDHDIKKHFSGIDLLVAGPPCQGFSVAGPSQYGKIDSRNNLIYEVLRFAQLLKPDICILENVKGILSGKLSPTKNAIEEYVIEMKKIGYYVKIFILQTADFGVPQWRERVFIYSAKKESYLPLDIKGEYGNNGIPWRTVNDALFDLPIIDSGGGIDELVPYPMVAQSDYQIWLRTGSTGVRNHVAMKHTPRLIERFKNIPIGGSLVDAPPEFGQRKRNGNELDVHQRFKMNNQRLNPNKISTAITASFQSNFIHPHLNRNLTAREGARLQSFSDNFVFCGPRTLMSKKLLEKEERLDEIGLSQYNQIGNAVAPLVAEGIGKTVLKYLGVKESI
ncbi:MAG: Cytosine-specific methyltransferase [Bacilli bacterium]|nr:Cytosine-specific methyltransferase [Bacilli bacterium]